MNPYITALLDLIKLIVIPILTGFSLLFFLMKATFAFSLFFFLVGSFFFIGTNQWLERTPTWMKKLEDLKIIQNPIYITYFLLVLMIIVALLVSIISFFVSEKFCLILFAAYATLGWICYRIFVSKIALYVQFLKADNLDAYYWYYNIEKEPKTLLSFARTLPKRLSFRYKVAVPKEQIQAIDLLFQQKYYYSIRNIQNFYFQFATSSIRLDVQQRIIRSMQELHEIYILQKDKKEFEKQQFPVMEQVGLFNENQLKLILYPELLYYWFDLAIENMFQYKIVQQLYEEIGAKLAEFVANPDKKLISSNVFWFFKENHGNLIIETKVEEILSKIPFKEDSEVYTSINYTYNMVLLSKGIVNNL